MPSTARCREGGQGVELRQVALHADEVMTVGRWLVTTPVRTVFDCARWLSFDDGLVAVDAAAHAGLITIEELSAFVDSKRRARGLAQVRQILLLADPFAESPMETRLRLLLVRNGLPRPVSQFEVRRLDGRFVARLDLAYPDHLVAVEYDGSQSLERGEGVAQRGVSPEIRHDRQVTPPVFRVPDTAARDGVITLDGPEGHHAADVRRLRVGEPIWITDGRGTRWECTVASVRRGALDATVVRVVDQPQPQPRLVVVQALAKGGRDEDAVEAMTEIGVDEILGWSASRSVAKWTDRTQAKWQSTADAASRQSRRTWWPVVAGPLSTSEVASRLGAADLAIVLHESAYHRLSASALPDAGEVVLVVGPEGGITDDELSAFRDAGAASARLGDTVLRSSTAGIAALSAICAQTRWR
ncbi:MAG TPA: 16S rRNA (uracil(1498)-N(3))-methyltransferase [Mycobacteriales bacterium]|nr:16S rRNA (uracil(1498)-N(3))-methyltransferase [Mycobacteriales bacterium]